MTNFNFDSTTLDKLPRDFGDTLKHMHKKLNSEARELERTIADNLRLLVDRE